MIWFYEVLDIFGLKIAVPFNFSHSAALVAISEPWIIII